MSITAFPQGTKAQQARSAAIQAVAGRINGEHRRYHMRVTTGGVSEDRYVSERSKDFLLEMGRRYGDWAKIEVIGATGAAKEPISMEAYRARKAAQRLNDGSFLEKLASSPLVWPGGKGPVR